MTEGIKAISGIRESLSQLDISTAPAQERAVKLEVVKPAVEEAPVQITKEQIQQAVEKMNRTMETYSTELRFKFHEKSGEYSIKIVNPKDNTVIKEIPPESVLDMVAYFKEMLGLLVDKFA